MTTKNQVMIFVVVVAVLLVISAYFFLTPTAPLISQVPEIEKLEIVPPSATGNIDDLVDALFKELSDEGLVISEEEGDTVFVTTDSQEVGDFGQSINESEL